MQCVVGIWWFAVLVSSQTTVGPTGTHHKLDTTNSSIDTVVFPHLIAFAMAAGCVLNSSEYGFDPCGVLNTTVETVCDGVFEEGDITIEVTADRPVACLRDDRTGNAYISALDWKGLGLSGSISTEVAWLNDLASLTLSDNDLQGKTVMMCVIAVIPEIRAGTLPTEIGDLSILNVLDLGNNPRLMGTLPSQMASLALLGGLTVQNCSFTGDLPKFSAVKLLLWWGAVLHVSVTGGCAAT
jgi:hypothetical protein